MHSVVGCVVPGCAKHTDSGKWQRDKQTQEQARQTAREYALELRGEFEIMLEPFRAEFTDLLRSFQCGALHLAPPQSDLIERMPEIFLSFHIQLTGITFGTINTVDALMAEHTVCEKTKDFMDEVFQTDVGRAISGNDIGYELCSELFDYALGRDWHGALFAEKRLSSLHFNGGLNRLGRFMGMRVRDLVTAYLYLRVVRSLEFERRVKALLGCYMAGNYPVHVLQNKTLLILTA